MVTAVTAGQEFLHFDSKTVVALWECVMMSLRQGAAREKAAVPPYWISMLRRRFCSSPQKGRFDTWYPVLLPLTLAANGAICYLLLVH